MPRSLTLVSITLLLAGGVGCSFFARPAPHKPVKFTQAPSPHGAERFPNWPLAPATSLEDLRLAERETFEVEEVDLSVGGTTGVSADVLGFPGLGEEVRFKVKEFPGDLDGINNAPRKEVAAYMVQRLFLDPEDYVVPTTLVHCSTFETWSKHRAERKRPTVKGTNCVLIAAAYWLKDVTLPAPLYDEQRFLTDPNYAYFLSNFNVFTHVIDHRDGRKGNFLVSEDDSRRQVFSIDNGSTFNVTGYNYFVANWNVMRVAAVRKATIDRLRELERSDLDFLEVAMQLDRNEDGILRIVPSGTTIDPDRGALYEKGTLQLGLTKHEIDEMWKRIQDLIASVDDGKLPVF